MSNLEGFKTPPYVIQISMKSGNEVINARSNKPVEIDFITLDEEETQYVTIQEIKITTQSNEQNYVSLTVK